MPSKRTKKLDLPSQQSKWPVEHRKFTDLVYSQSGFSVSQRRHALLDYENLGYTSLKLDSNLMKMLEGGKVQKTLSNMLKYSAKADEKGSSFASFSKRRDLIRLLLFIQIPGQQKDQFYINLFNFNFIYLS